MATAPTSGSTRFTLSEADAVAASRASIRAKFLSKLFLFTFAVLAAALVVLAGIVVALGDPTAFLPSLVPLAVCAFLFVAFDQWVIPASTRRSFRSLPALKREIEFSWNAAGFQLRTERESVDLPWQEITKVQQTGHVLLLHRSPRVYHVIPNRALNEGEADAIATANDQA